MSANPWRHGGLADLIVWFSDLGATSIVKTLSTIQDIVHRLDAIESETERREAASAMSKKFAEARKSKDVTS